MHVNTAVVKALMHLRGISEEVLCNLSHVARVDMNAWLYDIGEDTEERVPFEIQLEILKVLGINGETPRSDVVHYWRVYEPFFSKAGDSYWALNVMLKAFGKVQAVYLARESDPALNFQARATFGLRFGSFLAILDVTAHPLRSISFDPSNMADVAWLPDTMGVLLPDADYDNLEPGAMKVKGLQQYLSYNTEMVQWERLRDAALEKGMRAEHVAALLLGMPAPANLGHSTVIEPSHKVEETSSKAPPSAVPVTVAAALTVPRDESDEFRLFVVPVRGPDAVRATRSA